VPTNHRASALGHGAVLSQTGPAVNDLRQFWSCSPIGGTTSDLDLISRPTIESAEESFVSQIAAFLSLGTIRKFPDHDCGSLRSTRSDIAELHNCLDVAMVGRNSCVNPGGVCVHPAPRA
jgi:hypothetical protein